MVRVTFLASSLFVCFSVRRRSDWPRLSPELKLETANSTAVRAAISVRVIDGDTISLDDGRPNVRLVGYNAPETGSRARCEAERQKGEAAKQRFANSSATAGRTSVKLHVPASGERKAQMLATSVVAAALCEFVVWM